MMNLSIFSHETRVKEFFTFDLSEKTPVTHGSSSSSTFLIGIFLIAVILVSLPGNVAVFAAVFKQGLTNKPLNRLILVDQSITSWFTYQGILYHLFYNFTKTPLISVLGPTFCQYFYVGNIYGSLNSILGSLSIAVYRRLVLKGHMSCTQQHYLANGLLVICFVANIFMTIVYTSSLVLPTFASESCYGYDEEFTHVLTLYTNRKWPVHLVVFATAAVLQHMEGVIYFDIFLYIYKHDKTVSAFLIEKQVKRRRKRNALTMSSQIYGYLMEQFLIYALILIAFPPSKTEVMAIALLRHADFAIRCSLQALACCETRKELKSLIGFVWRQKMSDCSNDDRILVKPKVK